MSKKHSQKNLKVEVSADINAHNEMKKSYSISKSYKRSTVKSNTSEEKLKGTTVNSDSFIKTHNEREKDNSDERHKNSYDKISTQGSIKFDSKNHLCSDRFGNQYNSDMLKAKNSNLIGKKYSLKSDHNDEDSIAKSYSKKETIIRQRMIKSP